MNEQPLTNTQEMGRDFSAFIDFVIQMVHLFPLQYIEVEVSIRPIDKGGAVFSRVFGCEVTVESRFTGAVRMTEECASELEAQRLTVKVRRAVDATSLFGVITNDSHE